MSKHSEPPREVTGPRTIDAPDKSPLNLPSGWRKRTAMALGALLALTAAGEVASRLDDNLFNDTPILSTPDRAYDLVKAEPWGYRGRPDGRYKRWKLNSFGFLGPEIAEAPSGRRIMVLGASETFGLFEGKDKDYPAQLAVALARGKSTKAEVVNAGIAGQALPSLELNWTHWASRFKPDVVLVYPSAHFYLDIEAPRAKPPTRQMIERTPPLLRSRFAERVLDQVKQIPPLRSMRANMEIGAALAGKDDSYLFKTVPADRLEAFGKDLERVASAIERSGARPVLITHAFKMPLALDAKDRSELEYFRIYFPRATHEVLPRFSLAANEVIKSLAARRGWQAIDAASELSGRRELFADPVHFTAEGARRMATIIAAELGPRLARSISSGALQTSN